MCHSARLTQRNFPATREKTNKGLINEKVWRRRVRIFLNFYFQNFGRKGNISQKYKKKTAILTKNDEKREQRQILWKTVAHETKNTKPLIVTTTHDKTLSSGNWSRRKLQWGRNIPRNPPVPQIGRDKNVISGRLRERRLGPSETVLCEGTI